MKKNSRLDKMNLLKRALKHLGLKLKWQGSWRFRDGRAGFLAVDCDNNLCIWYKESHYVVGNYKISKLEDFLSAKWFERFATVEHRIENLFFGLSPEELAIQLDLLSEEREKA